jgi:hypothetical protein
LLSCSIINIIKQIVYVDTSILSDPAISKKFNITWQPVGKIWANDIHVKYMNISANSVNTFEVLNLTMEKDLYKERMDMWLSLPLSENILFSKELKKLRNFATSLLPKSYFSNLFLSLLLLIALNDFAS